MYSRFQHIVTDGPMTTTYMGITMNPNQIKDALFVIIVLIEGDMDVWFGNTSEDLVSEALRLYYKDRHGCQPESITITKTDHKDNKVEERIDILSQYDGEYGRYYDEIEGLEFISNYGEKFMGVGPILTPTAVKLRAAKFKEIHPDQVVVIPNNRPGVKWTAYSYRT